MTEKLFYKDPYLREARAKIEKIEAVEDGKIRVLLDRTIFYPEGVASPRTGGLSRETVSGF